MNITIRNETVADRRRVEEVAREAFWNLYFPGAHEHAVVNRMRNHPDFIADLAFIIEVDGQIEGAIFYTKSAVVLSNGDELDTISFGPVFISPEFHRKGLGKKLITHTLDLAREKGFSAVLLLGYPYHYRPYGFLGAKKYGISMQDGSNPAGLLALPLREGALDEISGYIRFSEALDITQEQVELFDASFPYKEKKVQESQREFELACATMEE